MKAELRPYQKEAVAAFVASPGHRGLFKMHPGAGKSIVACSVIEALKQKPDLPILPGPFLTLIVVPTIELRTQWSKILTEQEMDYDTFIITYAMAAIKMRTDRTFFDIFTLIIWDEAHHLAEGPVFQRLLLQAFKAPFSLALTSTPPTDPKNPMNRVFPLLYEYGFEQSRAEGYVAPVETFSIPIQLLDTEQKQYDELTKKIHGSILRHGDVKRAFRVDGPLFTARKQLVTMAEGKFEALKNLVEEIGHLDHPTRIFVWSEFIDALDHAKDHLDGAARLAMNPEFFSSAVLHGELPKAERERVFKAWGTEFRVLLVAKIGEEGLDVPECAHGIIMAGARTSRQNTQRVGRLLRPMKNKEARLWVIFAKGTMEEKLVDLVEEVIA